MKKAIILSVFLLVNSFVKGQFGFATGKYYGKDAQKFKYNWFIQTALFIPSMYFKIKISENFKIPVEIRPSFKFLWYNFNENLVMNSDSNRSSLTVDTNQNNVYKHKFFKKSSMMQSASLMFPVTFPLRPKKLKGVIISPGIWAEYILGGKFTRKFSQNGTIKNIDDKFKSNKDYFGLQRLQFGACLSIQYKVITLFSFYSFVPLFKPGKGLSVNKFETGIWFNFFWKRSKIYYTP